MGWLPSLLQTRDTGTVLVLALLSCYAVWTLLKVARFVSRWVRVAVGLRKVPSAPGGNAILGHVFPLATRCAWEKMREWVEASPPLVKFRIFHRTGLIVSDPRGLKRVFQVRSAGRRRRRRELLGQWRSIVLLAPGTVLRRLPPHPTRPSTDSTQTRAKIYEKDLDFSYKPFLPILGSGLVTANGAHWQKQRLLMAPALRIDMLDAIIPIAKRAVDRLSSKLEGFKGTGLPG